MALPVLFGINVDPVSAPAASPLRAAQRAERLGADLITIQDHPYNRSFLDTWTLLSYLAAATERITLVPTVASLPMRPPAVLAKSAASLDLLTGGRVQLGLGAGALWDAVAAMGGPRRSPREAVDALDEAITVIRAMWSSESSVRFRGDHYQLAGLRPGPTPSSELGLWLGSYGPRMLAMTGARADGWLPSHMFLGLDRLPDALARVDDAAAAAERSPAAVRKIYNIVGFVGRDSSDHPFRGPAQQWADQLVALVDQGMNGFVFWAEDDHDRQASAFAEEVVPRVREALG